jgi:hypothetical protein
MSKRFPIAPQHPERVCWGCDRYCAADKLLCGNGSERTQHPVELFGADWLTFGLDADAPEPAAAPSAPDAAAAR